jgi:hypothetical protein
MALAEQTVQLVQVMLGVAPTRERLVTSGGAPVMVDKMVTRT